MYELYLLTYLLTCSMVQSPSWEANWFAASQEISVFHGTGRFITALTSVRHLSLSWASPIQSIYPHTTSWRAILLLSTHLRLGLPSGRLPSSFPIKTLYTPLSSPIRVICPAHLILLDFITRFINIYLFIFTDLEICYIELEGCLGITAALFVINNFRFLCMQRRCFSRRISVTSEVLWIVDIRRYPQLWWL